MRAPSGPRALSQPRFNACLTITPDRYPILKRSPIGLRLRDTDQEDGSKTSKWYLPTSPTDSPLAVAHRAAFPSGEGGTRI